MQLKLFYLIFFILTSNFLTAQEDTEASKQREKIKADLLLNYYDQDGEHSPVTAGVGSEDQQVLAPMIILNIPVGTHHLFDLKLGVDNITSASTDRIDGTSSSASKNDTRVHANLWYDYEFHEKQSIGVMGGFSAEYDVRSLQGGVRYGIKSIDENRDFNITVQYFRDAWDLIYPIEFRADTSLLLKEDVRDSYNLSMTYSHVFTRRFQASITSDFIYQSGLLSTPFHRVNFSDQTVDIERLPDSRLKVALGTRWHYFWNDYFITRFYYRFYWDDFEILGNTIELEVPVKVKPNFTLTPFVRYHAQSGSKYFAENGIHDPLSEFHTSDYDLSKLSSIFYGLQMHYSPIKGKLFKSFQIDGIDLRYGYFDRDDGLTANNFSLGFSFSF